MAPLSESNTSADHQIEALMRDYGNDVLKTAWLYVKDRQISEDIFQEVFIKVYKNLSTFKGNSNIRTWITRITINTCKDYIKSSYHRRVVPMYDFMEDSITQEDHLDDIIKQEQSGILRKAVMSLPDKYRELMILVYYKELSLKDAAAHLEIKENTAKSLIKRGREQLRKKLEGRL